MEHGCPLVLVYGTNVEFFDAVWFIEIFPSSFLLARFMRPHFYDPQLRTVRLGTHAHCCSFHPNTCPAGY